MTRITVRLKPDTTGITRPGSPRTAVAVLVVRFGRVWLQPERRRADRRRRPRSAHCRSWSNPVSEERLGAILEKLESFETRSSLSSTTSTTRGIGAARQWILDEMKSYSPKLQVSFDVYQVPLQGRITRPVELRNVMAILPGRSPRRIYARAATTTPWPGPAARAQQRDRRRAGRSRRTGGPTGHRTPRSTTWRRASTTTAAARR